MAAPMPPSTPVVSASARLKFTANWIPWMKSPTALWWAKTGRMMSGFFYSFKWLPGTG